jgi:hypothetical protein
MCQAGSVVSREINDIERRRLTYVFGRQHYLLPVYRSVLGVVGCGVILLAAHRLHFNVALALLKPQHGVVFLRIVLLLWRSGSSGRFRYSRNGRCRKDGGGGDDLDKYVARGKRSPAVSKFGLKHSHPA